jgi:hypothetical protein
MSEELANHVGEMEDEAEKDKDKDESVKSNSLLDVYRSRVDRCHITYIFVQLFVDAVFYHYTINGHKKPNKFANCQLCSGLSRMKHQRTGSSGRRNAEECTLWPCGKIFISGMRYRNTV